MKKHLFALALVITLGAQAQEVSTLYFLENAPMRHLLNPAFQPVSDGYVNFSPLGYSDFWIGNNSLTVSDVIYLDPKGQTITALHPEYGNRKRLLNAFRNNSTLRTDATIDLLSFGFRHKEKGYVTIQILERMEMRGTMPKDFFSYLLSSPQVSASSVTSLNMRSLGLGTQLYTEIGGGYSYQLNDVWTIGGKVKLLLGTLYAGATHSQLDITGSTSQLNIDGRGNLLVAGPLNFSVLPQHIGYETLSTISLDKMLDNSGSITDIIKRYVTPSGYGAALDFGFTATPLKQLQVSVGLNDLGFIYWNRACNYTSSIDTTFTGVGTLEYSDYVYNGQFMADSIWPDVEARLKNLASAYTLDNPVNHFCRMITTKLNVGIDGRFFDNRLTVGLLSKTMLYNGHLSEEVTVGVAGKPFHWLNLAASYSLVDNGKYSNIGAGLSIMPYDGINMTLAMDYIPTSYAAMDGSYILPYKTKGFNVALGFSIVWGTNPKKQQPEPEPELVYERKALAVNTEAPTVEKVVLATEKTAVATGEATIADRDQDGVPDWEDECPDVPGPAFNKGCPEIKKELRTLLNKAMQGIQFETGKDIIRKSSFVILNKIAVQFIQHPEYYIEVQGHTDNVGNYDYNVDLSQRRAQAVMAYLVDAGVNADHMTAKGYGPDRPIADNDTKQGQALNRRVEFNIQFEQVQIETIYEHADSVFIETKIPEALPTTQDNIN